MLGRLGVEPLVEGADELGGRVLGSGIVVAEDVVEAARVVVVDSGAGPVEWLPLLHALTSTTADATMSTESRGGRIRRW
jgi:hypothetical protein